MEVIKAILVILMKKNEPDNTVETFKDLHQNVLDADLEKMDNGVIDQIIAGLEKIRRLDT
jgi:hypothetical protein